VAPLGEVVMSADRDTAVRELEEGNRLCLSGEVVAGVDRYRRAIEADPEFAPAHMMLGAALQALGRVAEAREPFERGAALDPSQANAHFGLGNVYLQLGRLDDAAAAYHRALELNPNFPDALLNLGVTYGRKRHFDLAVDVLRMAIQVKPGFPEAQGNLGAALRNLGKFEAAEAAFRQALPERPGVVDVRTNLGLLLFDQGRIGEAIALYEEAMAAKPDHVAVWRNRIAAVLYDPARDEDKHRDLLKRFEARFARSTETTAAPPANLRDPERRLRIGYVSSDLVDNPVARNLMPVLEHRDRQRFEVIAYAEVVRADEMTDRLRAVTDDWRWTIGLSDADLAAQIRQDRIDVLVLLATRLDKGRPLLAAHRAAPVQVSFHDPGTSGLSAMEYLIADRVLVPRRPAEKFTERVIRLPSFYIHAPIENAPAVAPLPALSQGYVTFGSFNNSAKVNDRVLALWGEVLRAVPNSRLKLKFKNWFANPTVRDRVLRGLKVEPDRIEFGLADTPQSDHMALYADIDIALDPFPFTGSTTTFEALWMGVPVVTLLGDMMVGRWSASMLRALKLDELIARNAAAYVHIASGLARDTARLSTLRADLRDGLRASPLTDGRLRARQMDRVYRALWRRWCRRP
jgi:predicted O-linked N-acetylglucosamine transferase (SPINDLY family)